MGRERESGDAGDPFYSAENMEALREGIEQGARGEVAASCTADGFDELVAALRRRMPDGEEPRRDPIGA